MAILFFNIKNRDQTPLSQFKYEAKRMRKNNKVSSLKRLSQGIFKIF